MPAFSPPIMPLTLRIYDAPIGSPLAPPRVTTPCQLYYAKPYSAVSFGGSQQLPENWVRFLLVPAGTDIRGPNGIYVGDTVDLAERPHWFYFVRDVDDRWKGFPNEYRMAVAIPAPVSWVWPMP